jgi:ERCC4-type nuclease
MKIICDTREQLPLIFKDIPLIRKKLDAGDYSIEGYEDRIAIERKSPIDLFGTLGKGHERFMKEIERAQQYEYFAIVVEASITDIALGEFEGRHQTRMNPQVVLQICFTLKMKYDVDVIFCRSRHEASTTITHLFKAFIKQQQYAKKVAT